MFSGIYCNKHKLENMVDVQSKKCILCDKTPLFNYENENENNGI